jgi:benzoyl-CoA reductase/2-hydroxyglutaryl-CoA dehydratase subunit BcrC/BadD/HgdB
MGKTVGFTTTIPSEIIFSSGLIPCDLNNIFVTHPDPIHYITIADRDGFPTNMCNWIKGLYGVIRESNIDTVISVMEGDCSNTRALAEILSYKGIRVIPFSFPYDRDEEALEREIAKLASAFGVRQEQLVEVRQQLLDVRESLAEIDRMTWQDRVVTGQENNLWQLCSSDMNGNLSVYSKDAKAFINEAASRQAFRGIPLGYVGVPPINPDLHQFVEDLGCYIMYNEVQRQFALPYSSKSLTDLYLQYTYPYGIFARLADIKAEIERRGLKGIIHYVQAFCYRAVEDIILRETLGLPIITIEGDLPKPLDTRTKLRLEAFVEMLKSKEE